MLETHLILLPEQSSSHSTSELIKKIFHSTLRLASLNTVNTTFLETWSLRGRKLSSFNRFLWTHFNGINGPANVSWIVEIISPDSIDINQSINQSVVLLLLEGEDVVAVVLLLPRAVVAQLQVIIQLSGASIGQCLLRVSAGTSSHDRWQHCSSQCVRAPMLSTLHWLHNSNCSSSSPAYAQHHNTHHYDYYTRWRAS